MHWQILAALLAGGAIGSTLTGSESAMAGWLVSAFAQTGELFLNALKMLVVPLIVASIIAGLTQQGSQSAIGRMG